MKDLKTSLSYISVYYASSSWGKLLDETDRILQSIYPEMKWFFLFLDKQGGDAIKMIFGLNDEDKKAFELSFFQLTDVFLKKHPSRRLKKNHIPGTYLWELSPNNSIKTGYFKSGKDFLDYENQSFLDRGLVHFACRVSQFIIKAAVCSKNIIDTYTFTLFLLLNGRPILHSPAIFADLLEEVIVRSEFHEQSETLREIYTYAATDVIVNHPNFHYFIFDPGNSEYLQDHEKKIMLAMNSCYEKESNAVSAFRLMIKIITDHFGIDYPKQLYVLKLFHFFFLETSDVV